MEIITIIIIFIIIGSITPALYYFYLLFLNSKASIYLTLNKTKFQPAQNIEGHIDIKLKEQSQLQYLIINITGQRQDKITQTDSKNPTKTITKTKWTTIYTKDYTLDSNKITNPKYKQSYPFQIPIPNFQINDQSPKMKWTLQTQIKTQNFTLNDKKEIKIN